MPHTLAPAITAQLGECSAPPLNRERVANSVQTPAAWPAGQSSAIWRVCPSGGTHPARGPHTHTLTPTPPFRRPVHSGTQCPPGSDVL
jgi:hypothetical protein